MGTKTRHFSSINGMRPTLYSVITATGFSLLFYARVVRYLHEIIRPTADTARFLPSQRPLVRPEFDLFFYALGLFCIPVTIFLLYTFFRHILSHYKKKFATYVMKYATFLRFFDYLFLFILWVLGAISVIMVFFSSWFSSSDSISLFRHNIYPYFSGFSTKQAVVTALSMLITGVLRYLFRKHTPRRPLLRYSIDCAVILSIILFVSAAIPTQAQVAPVDYIFVISPAHDVIKGKTLLVDVHAQYGLLMTYVLAAIFSHTALNTISFFFFNYVVMILGYIGMYAIVLVWLQSRLYAFVCIFLLALHHYFAQQDPLLYFGQLTFLRFGMWIPVMASVLIRSRSKTHHPLYHWIELSLVGSATFWGFDVGCYVLGAYISARAIEAYQSTSAWKDRFRAFSLALLQIGITLTAFFFLISIFTILRSGHLPDWYLFIEAALFFTGGWGMLPMPSMGAWQIICGGYLIAMIYMFFHRKHTDIRVLSFIVAYGCFQFAYYAGRSTNNNLRSVIVPFLVLVTWFMYQTESFFVTHPWRDWKTWDRSFLAALLVLGIVWSSVLTTVGVLNVIGTLTYKNERPIAVTFSPETASFQESLDTIVTHLSEIETSSGRLAVISDYDGEVLLATNRTNVIDSNMLLYFPLTASIHTLGKQLLDQHPSYVIMDHDTTSDRVAILAQYVQQHYHFSRNIGYFDIWEHNSRQKK